LELHPPCHFVDHLVSAVFDDIGHDTWGVSRSNAGYFLEKALKIKFLPGAEREPFPATTILDFAGMFVAFR